MKKIVNKIRKVRMTRWNKLTSAEKVMRIVMDLVKYAAIVALIVALSSVIVAVAAGVFIAFGIMSAVAGGFSNASKAYRPGDVYVNPSNVNHTYRR